MKYKFKPIDVIKFHQMQVDVFIISLNIKDKILFKSIIDISIPEIK